MSHSTGVRRWSILPLLALVGIGQGATTAHAVELSSRTAVAITPAQRSVLEFENRRREAVAAKDLKALEQMTASDLKYVDAGGAERDKPQYLAHIQEENIRYNAWSLDDTAAKVYGGLAVATGTFNFDVTVNTRVNKGSQHFTAVYVRQDGGWKLLIWHPTVAARTP